MDHVKFVHLIQEHKKMVNLVKQVYVIQHKNFYKMDFVNNAQCFKGSNKMEKLVFKMNATQDKC